MARVFWVALVGLAVVTVAFAPSRVPARPEPGAARVIAAVFEGQGRA